MSTDAVPPAAPAPVPQGGQVGSGQWWWLPYMGLALIGMGLVGLGVYDRDNATIIGAGLSAISLAGGLIMGIRQPVP